MSICKVCAYGLKAGGKMDRCFLVHLNKPVSDIASVEHLTLKTLENVTLWQMVHRQCWAHYFKKVISYSY